MKEICLQQEAFKQLNLANVGTNADTKPRPKTILIAKEMLATDKEKLKRLLKQYKDIFP